MPQTCIKRTTNLNLKCICKPFPIKKWTYNLKTANAEWIQFICVSLPFVSVFNFRQLHLWSVLVLLYFFENRCSTERKNKPTFVPSLFANQVRRPWLALSWKIIWTLTDWTQTAGFLSSGQQIEKNKIKANSSSQAIQQDWINVQLLMNSYFKYLQKAQEKKKRLAS